MAAQLQDGGDVRIRLLQLLRPDDRLPMEQCCIEYVRKPLIVAPEFF